MINPTVSVVIPVFNRAHLLEDLFENLNKQTYRNFEAVFVDDASEVPIANLINRFKANFQYQLITNPINKGVSFSRNIGVNAAKGQYVAFLDSDDLWNKRKLEKQLNKCIKANGTVFSMTQTQVVRDCYTEFLPKNFENFKGSGQDYILSDGGFAQVSSFLITKELACEIGFNNCLAQYEDYLFFMHAFNRCDSFIYIDEPLVIWDDRDSADRLSGNKELNRALEFYRIIENDFSKNHAYCFINRFVSPYHFYANPSFFLKIFYMSFKSCSCSNKEIVWSFIKSVLGDSIISKIRRVCK
jgi:glycosyltransferase involved in cell wall biosynthesis